MVGSGRRGYAVLPLTPSPSWFSGFSGHQLVQQIGNSLLKAQGSSAKRPLWSTGLTYVLSSALLAAADLNLGPGMFPLLQEA